MRERWSVPLINALAVAGAAPRLRSSLMALQQGSFRPDIDRDAAAGKARIRCPHCRWSPERRSRWYCLPCGAPEFFRDGCGHGWNTFDTRGRCPGCDYQWRHTSCLSCSRWARHEDWYAEHDDHR